MYEDKNVLFVIGSLCDGGAERVMSILASGCAELGANVTLVILRDKDVVYPVSPKVNCIFIKSTSKFHTIERILKLHKILKESNAEKVIPFVQIVSLYTIISNIGVGKDIILSERNDPRISIFSKKYGIKDKIGRFFMQILGLHKLACWTVFQTPDAMSWYSKKVQEKSSIIPNPLDVDNLPERYEGKRNKQIVAAGRLSIEKNFEMLIRGFEKFHNSHPEYTLVIYGEGKQRKELESIVDRLNLSEYVYMPGFVKNLQSEIWKASAYVSTSNHEGISNSMLEALGMGIPTIVTDCPVGGSRMFVKTDVNGILIKMNDIDGLASALNKVIDDELYSERISKEATKIRQSLSRNSICKQWLELV